MNLLESVKDWWSNKIGTIKCSKMDSKCNACRKNSLSPSHSSSSSCSIKKCSCNCKVKETSKSK